MIAIDLIRGLAVGAIALFVLQQADRGIWWHVCNFRSIRTNESTEEIFRSGNGFFVPAKLVPAVIACTGVVWMITVDNALGGLILGLVGIVAFGCISLVQAYRTIGLR